MINGTVLAPFRHDSTWPDEVAKKFRQAVYYFHVHVPGRDCVNILRELIRYKKRLKRSGTLPIEWQHLESACNKVAHLAVRGANDEELLNLARNLLVFANLLLIREYGLEVSTSVHLEARNLAENERYEAASTAARDKFMRCIDHAYESLETAIEALRQSGGSLRGSLNLEKTSVRSPIPSTHHFIENGDDLTFVVQLRNEDACEYQFSPHDPLGWVMVGGSPSSDIFADDAISTVLIEQGSRSK